MRTIFAIAICILQVLVLLPSMLGCDSRRPKRLPSNNSTTQQWFQGGTLHDATIGQWKAATYANKLATAGDWLAGTTWKGHLNSTVDFDRMKIKAQMLVRGVDIAVDTADETANDRGRQEIIQRMEEDSVVPIAFILIRGTDDFMP